ncbi:MAG: hypothetical protein ABH891_02010 [Candidatus Omnitrophota bacterium]
MNIGMQKVCQLGQETKNEREKFIFERFKKEDFYGKQKGLPEGRPFYTV